MKKLTAEFEDELSYQIAFNMLTSCPGAYVYGVEEDPGIADVTGPFLDSRLSFNQWYHTEVQTDPSSLPAQIEAVVEDAGYQTKRYVVDKGYAAPELFRAGLRDREGIGCVAEMTKTAKNHGLEVVKMILKAARALGYHDGTGPGASSRPEATIDRAKWRALETFVLENAVVPA